jgi:hypothetical protein
MTDIEQLREEIAKLRERVAVLEQRANVGNVNGPLWIPGTPVKDPFWPPNVVTCEVKP